MEHKTKLTMSVSTFLYLSLAAVAWALPIFDCDDVYEYEYNYLSDFNGDCIVDACDLVYLAGDNWLYDFPTSHSPCGPTEGRCVKTLYIDGQYILEATGEDELTFSLGEIRIVSEGGGYIYNEYIGALDEFALYEGKLSVDRIQAHYDANDSGYVAAVSADNPLLWLRFEDDSMSDGDTCENWGSSPTDGRYRIVGSGSPFTQVPGINDSNAVSVNDSGEGSAGHQISVPDNGEFGSGLVPEGEGGSVTVEVWVNFEGIGLMSGNDYPRFYTTAGAYGLHMNRQGPGDGNDICIHGGTDSYVSIPFDLNDSQWHHVVITYDSIPQIICPPDYNYTDGVMESNPILWLRFEDEDPCDYSGNDNWVSYGPAASIVSVPEAMGKCVKLDGSQGEGVYGVAAAKEPYNPNSIEYRAPEHAFVPNDITFELWYKTFPAGEPQPETFAYFFQQHGPFDNENTAPAAGNAGGTIRISVGSKLAYTGVNTKFDEDWHHIVVTYDEDYQDEPCHLRVELWQDGLLKWSGNYIDPCAYLGPEWPYLLIGAENKITDTYNVFAGYIDEFAIYEGVLDANQIEGHYWAWQPKDCNELRERLMAEAWDRNGDCLINYIDFAWFAQEWLLCNDPVIGPPSCPANWPE